MRVDRDSRFWEADRHEATRFSGVVIAYAVKQIEMGVSVKEIARKYGVCENTVCRWRRKYHG